MKKGKFRVLTVRTAEADCMACVKGKYNDLPAQTAESQCKKKDCNAGSYINADKSVRLEVGYSM